jgi:Ca-activated chloride channel family protein
MSFVYPWVFFFFIPLTIFYTTDIKKYDKEKQRQRKLLFGAAFFMLLALSRPVITHSLNEQKFDAQNFIIALDASYSMQADDVKPNRYTAAKETIKSLLEAQPNNRFSIFTFTSNALLISPPTTDTAISLIALDALNPKYIMTKGTSLLALLQSVAKTSYEKKKLILFSDGGEEHNLDKLVNFAKEHSIIPYVIAVGSSKGAVLHENGKNLKDDKGNLVISRVNPILKDFAQMSGGKFYALDSSNKNIANAITADLVNNDSQEDATIEVMSYTELFAIPTFLALILFIIAVTKIQFMLPFVLIIILPYPAHSAMFDFYHLSKAKDSFAQKKYKTAVNEFDKIEPSVQSYYNKGVAYYKDKQYKNAIKTFTQIRTQKPKLKQKLFYNMGNCAVKLQKYDRAKIYYQKALQLGYDKDAYSNLLILQKYKEKVDISDMLPPNETKKQTQASKRNNTKKDESKSNAANSNSNQKVGESSNGSASNKGKQTKKPTKKSNKLNKFQYKIGYKAYELINKGYTNENHPW